MAICFVGASIPSFADDRAASSKSDSTKSDVIAYEAFDYSLGSLRNADHGIGWKQPWRVSRVSAPTIVRNPSETKDAGLSPWMQSGGYSANPQPNSIILADGQILIGFQPDTPPAEGKELMPVVWVRDYTADSGAKGRVFTTTHGCSEDFLDDGFRRMLINASFWCLGMEKEIKSKSTIDFVGPYEPTVYGFGVYKEFVKPSDLAGWDTPLFPGKAKVKAPRKKKK